jgi:hypothetical protein
VRASPSRQEAGEAIPGEGGPCLVEGLAGEAEGGCGASYRLALGLDTAQHLVLDLHQVSRIEEGVGGEGLIGDGQGTWVEGTLLLQGGQLLVDAAGGSHGGPPYRELCKRNCAIALDRLASMIHADKS